MEPDLGGLGSQAFGVENTRRQNAFAQQFLQRGQVAENDRVPALSGSAGHQQFAVEFPRGDLDMDVNIHRQTVRERERPNGFLACAGIMKPQPQILDIPRRQKEGLFIAFSL